MTHRKLSKFFNIDKEYLSSPPNSPAYRQIGMFPGHRALHDYVKITSYFALLHKLFITV